MQSRDLYKKRSNRKLCNQGSSEGSDPMRKDGRSADGGNVTAARRQGRERDRSIDFLTIDDTKT